MPVPPTSNRSLASPARSVVRAGSARWSLPCCGRIATSASSCCTAPRRPASPNCPRSAQEEVRRAGLGAPDAIAVRADSRFGNACGSFHPGMSRLIPRRSSSSLTREWRSAPVRTRRLGCAWSGSSDRVRPGVSVLDYGCGSGDSGHRRRQAGCERGGRCRHRPAGGDIAARDNAERNGVSCPLPGLGRATERAVRHRRRQHSRQSAQGAGTGDLQPRASQVACWRFRGFSSNRRKT
jgi:hypothetical protein